MSNASTRVFFEDGRVAWTSFDADRDTAGAVLWPSREEAWRADWDAIRSRFEASECSGARTLAVHTDRGTVVVDADRLVPVAVESVVGGVANWWTGLALANGKLLATNHESCEVRVKERGLFRPHPDYAPSHIPVTGPDWADVDWSDAEPAGSPTP